jgi:hypothetical protein
MKHMRMQGNASQSKQNARYIKMQANQQRFIQWMMSDNVIKQYVDGKSYWTSQDAQYKNKLYTMQEAWIYFEKEFINQ